MNFITSITIPIILSTQEFSDESNGRYPFCVQIDTEPNFGCILCLVSHIWLQSGILLCLTSTGPNGLFIEHFSCPSRGSQRFFYLLENGSRMQKIGQSPQPSRYIHPAAISSAVIMLRAQHQPPGRFVLHERSNSFLAGCKFHLVASRAQDYRKGAYGSTSLPISSHSLLTHFRHEFGETLGFITTPCPSFD
jgi:hypothetical protein